MRFLRQHRRLSLTLLATVLLQAVVLATCLVPRHDASGSVHDDMLGALVMCTSGVGSGTTAAPATGGDPAPHTGSACWHCVLVAAFVFAVALTAALARQSGQASRRGWGWQTALAAWLAPLRLGGLGGRAPPLHA